MWKLFSSVRKWIRNYIYFSKATSCIRGLVLSHSYVKHAIISVLIMYITKELWKPIEPNDSDSFQQAAVAINVLNGISGILVCVLAFITNTVGPFEVIASTNAAYLLGLVLLLRLSIHLDDDKGSHLGHASDNYVFFGAGLLLALGEAGRSAGLSKFLDDQYLSEADYKIKLPETSSAEEKEEEEDTKKRVESRQTAMWNQPWFIGAAALAPLALVIEPWPDRLLVSVVALEVSYLLFWSGVFAYSRNVRNESNDPAVEDAPRSTGLSQAFKSLSPSKETAPSWKFWLKPVSRKRYYKEMLVMCLAFVVYSLVEATGSTFFFKQVSQLKGTNIGKLKIPPFYFSMLKSLSSFLISYLWKLLVPKQSKRSTLVKIGCGLVCSVLCMVAAWQVEIHKNRRTKIDPEISMSNLWLIPQFSLLGFTKGLAADGLVDFFADRVDADGKRKAMYYGSCAGKLVLGIGTLLTAVSIVGFRKTLLVDDLNTNRLDKYYRGVVFIGVANLCYYFCVAVYFYRKQDDNAQVCCEPDGNEQSETSFKNNKYHDQDVSLISVRETPTKSSFNCCAIFF
ncbi:protein NRT1/ PTR FAMILY 5.10-like [Argentina anserina]|uniref:protein NRT1/ PTR FAMILY 5.10-like n=1 Tax=Argentina anserina TaxID=57926 RepID=UPI0021766347|nr:protein NRT1/ PTR FAMILY 5.10-like [Potentilla anserina]